MASHVPARKVRQGYHRPDFLGQSEWFSLVSPRSSKFIPLVDRFGLDLTRLGLGERSAGGHR